jgi:hypothetical protein
MSVLTAVRHNTTQTDGMQEDWNDLGMDEGKISKYLTNGS